VDIADHRYTKPCFDYLKSQFGDRVHLLEGDSREVVPVLRQTPQQFDLFHIDGGHGFGIAHADLCNILEFCKDGATLLVDDTDDPMIDALCDFMVVQGRLTRIKLDRLWTSPPALWHSLFRVHRR
jgi:hypothetical protein